MIFYNNLLEPNRQAEHVLDPETGKIIAVFISGKCEVASDIIAGKLKQLGYKCEAGPVTEPEKEAEPVKLPKPNKGKK